MEKLIYLALIEALESADIKPEKGQRGRRGPKGSRGESADIDLLQDFISKNVVSKISESLSDEKLSEKFATKNEMETFCLDWLTSPGQVDKLKLKFKDLTADEIEQIRGPRGHRGKDGKPGKDFDLEESKPIIISILNNLIDESKEELRLKFDDLTDRQIEEIRGPRGFKGKDGKPGKDFDFEENKLSIAAMIDYFIDSKKEELKLKFKDLDENQIEEIRGPRGHRGKDGKPGRDFDFFESKGSIEEIIFAYIDSVKDNLKLKYSDLNESDLYELRGRRGMRGQKGKPGKDFVFSEHQDKINQIIDELLDSKKDQLKLKFSDLSSSDRNLLKLKFSDLTSEELIQLKGDRGPRGFKGSRGEKGESAFDIWLDEGNQGTIADFIKSFKGPRGVPGLPGPRGLTGFKGQDGEDGQDAPRIVDVEILEGLKESIFFRFHFEDLTFLDTNEVELPKAQQFFNQIFTHVAGLPGYIVTGDTIQAGWPVIVNGDDQVVLYDDLTLDERVIGLAKSTGAIGEEIGVVTKDKIIVGVLSGFTAGDSVYWDGSNFANVIPSTSGSHVWRLGVAKNSTDLHVNVEYVKKNKA